MKKLLRAVLKRELKVGERVWNRLVSDYPHDPKVQRRYDMHCWIIDRLYEMYDLLGGE